MTLSEVDFFEEESKLDEWESLIGRQPPHKTCYPCALRDFDEFASVCNKRTPGVLRIFGIDYHENDFVYVKTREQTLDVAQIPDLMMEDYGDKLTVRLLEKDRPDEASVDRANFASTSHLLSGSMLIQTIAIFALHRWLQSYRRQ